MTGIIEYFTDSGYDADDLTTQLGLTKATSFLHRLLFNHADKVDNPNFIVQLEDFIRSNLQHFNLLQLVRMLEIVKMIPRFAKDRDNKDLIDKIEAHMNTDGDKKIKSKLIKP